MNVRQVAYAMRQKCGGFLDVDDLTQEGEIAVLEATRRGAVPEDARHREAYLQARVRGAMIDAARRAHGHFDKSYQLMQPIGDFDTAGNAIDPERNLRACRAVKHLLDKSPRRHAQALKVLYNGGSTADAATALDVSSSRISHICVEARNTLRSHWP
jgi:RNA polymerase sigma factor (sigma-70 family)